MECRMRWTEKNLILLEMYEKSHWREWVTKSADLSNFGNAWNLWD